MIINENKKINEGMKFRPFTKNDWYGFAGANKSADGKYPVIAENSDCTIVVCPDDDGKKFVINVLTPDTEDYGGKMNVYKDERSAMDAAKLLANLSTNDIEKTIKRWR